MPQELNRDECERLLIKKMTEALDIYHRYNPNGEYLTMCTIGGHISMNNEHWEDGTDADRPIDVHVEV